MIIKLISEEATLSAADTVGLASCVRVYNNSGSEVLITRRDSSNNVLGSCTLANNEVSFLQKLSTDTLEAGANVLVTSVAFTIS